MRNAELEEAQDGIKIARRSINNLRYMQMTPPMERLSEYLEEKNSTRKVGGDRKEKKNCEGNQERSYLLPRRSFPG